jgi:hypothetical protein
MARPDGAPRGVVQEARVRTEPLAGPDAALDFSAGIRAAEVRLGGPRNRPLGLCDEGCADGAREHAGLPSHGRFGVCSIKIPERIIRRSWVFLTAEKAALRARPKATVGEWPPRRRNSSSAPTWRRSSITRLPGGPARPAGGAPLQSPASMMEGPLGVNRLVRAQRY